MDCLNRYLFLLHILFSLIEFSHCFRKKGRTSTLTGVVWMEPEAQENHILLSMKGNLFCCAFWNTCEKGIASCRRLFHSFFFAPNQLVMLLSKLKLCKTFIWLEKLPSTQKCSDILIRTNIERLQPYQTQ